MIKKLFFIVSAFVIFGLNAGNSSCQAQDFKRNRMERPAHRGQQPENDPEAEKMIESLKVWKISDELKVDEKLSEKLFPRIRKLESLKKESRKEMTQLMIEIRKALATENADEKRLNELVENVTAMQNKHHQQISQAYSEIFSILTAEQKARFILIEDDFPREIRRFLKKRFRENQNRLPEEPEME